MIARMSHGFGDMQSLLKQAQEMQRRVQDTQRALSERIVEGTAGGGLNHRAIGQRIAVGDAQLDHVCPGGLQRQQG
jgi:hypothetical protein